MSNQYAQLVEKINRVVRDRGDVELMVHLDRIMDKETESEQAAVLGDVVKILNQGKKPPPSTSSVRTTPPVEKEVASQKNNQEIARPDASEEDALS